MATNFVSYRSCSLGAEVSLDLLDRFSQSLHHMVGIEKIANRPKWAYIAEYLNNY